MGGHMHGRSEHIHAFSRPEMRRRCTDIACCGAFMVALMLQGILMVYAFQNGNPAIYAGLPDWQGNFCGVSASVKNQSFLYFCQDDSGRLNYTTPICLEACPNPAPGTMPTQTQCPLGVGIDYPTKAYGGMLCLPTDPSMYKEVAKATWDHQSVRWLLEVAEVPKAWQPLAISGVVALILALCYLTFLDKGTFCLLWTGIAMLIVITGSLGSYFLWCAHRNGADGLPSTGDSMWDLTAGLGLYIVCLTFFCIACFQTGGVNTAIDSIKASAECTREMPTLLLMPLGSLMVRVPLMVFLIAGGVYLASIVREVPVQDQVNGVLVVNHIDVEYDGKEYVFLAYYTFVSVWIMGVTTGLMEFSASYATEMWFFSTYRPSYTMRFWGPFFGTLEGAVNGLQYHMGTFAYGTLAIMFLQIPRIIVGTLTKSCRMCGDNACMQICGCCVDCYERNLKYVTKDAYMDVAMHGSDFWQATLNAYNYMHSESTTVVVLHGATWIFQLTGTAAISAAGAYTTYLIVTREAVYNNTFSELYIPDPLFLTAIAGIISFSVALPFMLIFGHVSDTILYCFAVEEHKSDKIEFGSASMSMMGGTMRGHRRALETSGMLSQLRR
mmetsp:Transcript_81334/g.209356  ORF Transcript_81334/g.209356 Transcript_81334/m.209356 type:complete len:609 (-) Transcript_81334:138-1964(-)